MAIIYLCKNIISKKQYVGITTRELPIRKWEHIKELNAGSKNGIWQQEYDEYGKESFVFSILEDNVPVDKLLELENNYIIQYNCLEPNGYNKKLNSVGTSVSRDYLKNSSLNLEQIASLLKDISSIDPYLDTKQLSIKYNMSIDAMMDILRCKSHKWYSIYFPEDYALLEKIHTSGIERKSFLLKERILQALEMYSTKSGSTTDSQIASISGISLNSLRDLVRGKAYQWASITYPELYTKVRNMYNKKNEQKVFHILDTATNVVYKFSTNTEAAKALSIDHRRVSDLVTGAKKVINNRYMLSHENF
jgi:group I intron endonuclease